MYHALYYMRVLCITQEINKMDISRRKRKNAERNASMLIRLMLDGFKYWGKVELWYSQEYWLKQFKRFFAYDIKRRQLNYVFAGIEKIGILKRYRRHIKCPERGYIFKSSRFYIAEQGWKNALYIKLVSQGTCSMMINAIKKHIKAGLGKPEEWVTQEFCKEYLPDSYDPLPEPDG